MKLTRSMLARMAYDVVALNLALVTAFVTRYLSIVFLEFQGSLHGTLMDTYIDMYIKSMPFYTLECLVIFYFSGFYTRTRGYAGRYKVIVIVRTVTLCFLALTITMYFLYRTLFFPRGVTFLAWVLTLVLVGVPRLSKDIFLARFTVEPKPKEKREVQPRKVLVVGGAGYIGSILARQLLGRGYDVRVLDTLMFGDFSIKELRGHQSFELMKGDFRHVEAVVRSVKDMDAVVHLGAIVGDPACSVDSEYTVDVNYAATQMIREVCKGYGVNRFIFASTCSVYGAADNILDERSATNPVSLYARTKLDCEEAIFSLADGSFSPTILRIATAFGMSYRPRFDLVVNLLTALAVTENKIRIFGGEQWRPFIHVQDIANAMISLLDAPLEMVGGQVFNVGANDMNFRIHEIGEKVRNLLPDTDVEIDDSEDDLRNYRVSFDKIRNTLGFKCEKSIEYGIQEIIDALQSNRVEDFRANIYSNYLYTRKLIQENLALKHDT